MCEHCASLFAELLSGPNRVCPQCGSDRDSVVLTGLTGCPGCYGTFSREIGLMQGLPGKMNEPVRN